jgi:hypothetical protein
MVKQNIDPWQTAAKKKQITMMKNDKQAKKILLLYQMQSSLHWRL